jgi:mannose-1-phosphate guanylyltransferase/phosphomannomutase
MKAIILAGGFGTRLHPFTLKCPKPMIPLANKPVLAHTLDLLKRHFFSEVVIAVHYLGEQIEAYFGNGHSLGLALRYAVEEKPLGTAGSIKNAQPYLDRGTFLVISGDIVTDIDLSKAIHFHRQKEALATVVLKQVANPQEYGVVVTDQSGRIRQYLEKPDRQPIISNRVNTGIYILEPKIFDYMEPHKAYDFSYDIFPLLVSQNAPLFGYRTEGYWRDIGTVQSYRQAEADVVAGKVSHIVSRSYESKVESLFRQGVPDKIEPLITSSPLIN